MIITRIIEKSFNPGEPLYFFTDVERNLMNLLKETFEGKCYKGCFITKILKIIDTFDGLISSDEPDCTVSINVRFEVEAIIYTNGEIVPNCVLSKILSGKRFFISSISNNKSKVAILIDENNFNRVIREGQSAPIRVTNATFKIGNNTVFAKGELYLPKKPEIYTIKVDDLEEYLKSEKDKVKVLKNNLEKLKNANNIVKKIDSYFSPSSSQSKKNTKHLIDLFSGKISLSGEYVKFYKFAPYNTDLIIIEKTTIDESSVIIDSGVAVETIMNEINNHIEMTLQTGEFFADEKEFKKQDNVWKIYENINNIS